MPHVNSPSNLAAAGGTLTQDVYTGASEWLLVIGILGPTAAAAGDVSVSVQPYLDDHGDTNNPGPTLSDIPLGTDASSVAAVLANNKAQVLSRFRVAGLRKVRVTLKNNNATTALPGQLDFQMD